MRENKSGREIYNRERGKRKEEREKRVRYMKRRMKIRNEENKLGREKYKRERGKRKEETEKKVRYEEKRSIETFQAVVVW